MMVKVGYNVVSKTSHSVFKHGAIGLCVDCQSGGYIKVHIGDCMVWVRPNEYELYKQTPPTWGEMTDEEKGAILLARHDGKVIEYLWYDDWVSYQGSIVKSHAYRVKPSETVIVTNEALCDGEKGKVTITTVDGVRVKFKWVAE